ncbi:MAG TPA: DUF4097 family beta strand repeat-containing protein [Gemmatimonadaceae bacterium]|jgi:DUF4097 and DUF4098 domain-containing protein YvlB
MPRRLLALAAVTLLAVAAPPAARAQRGDRAAQPPLRAIDTTFAFDDDGLVDLTQLSGEIVVTAWDRDEVRVVARAQYGRVDPSFSRQRIFLRVIPDAAHGGRLGDSRYELLVPEGTRVKAAATSGAVRVSGTRGEVEIGTRTGAITVTDVQGLVTLTSLAGAVTTEAIDGDLAVSTAGGAVTARDVTGDVRVKTVGGAIDLRDVDSRSVSAQSTGGSVTFEGSLAEGGRYELGSHAGTVRLLLPEDASVELTVETFTGEVATDFPVTLAGGARRGARPRTLGFTLGDGAARVSIQTFSGGIVLQRVGGG